MKYKNLLAEMGRNRYDKKTLCEEMNKRGCEIGYYSLCRRFRDEAEFTISEALAISEILHTNIEKLFEV